MDWIARLNAAVDYIEAHLTEEIDFEKAARVAACSSYHFQRMFSYMAEMPLSEYIRRRRMSRAAADLASGEKVVDVALKYGYDSPTAFNRAFRSAAGASPSSVKTGQASIRMFTPIRFTITIKGAMEMDVKLVKKQAFTIVGIERDIYQDMEKNFTVIPPMWEKAVADGTIERMCKHMNAQPKAVLGVSFCEDDRQWRYAIAVATSDTTDEFKTYTVPAATWAIFAGEGTNKDIQTLAKRIHTEWFPTSGYDFDHAPEIEVYYSPDPNNAKFEIWLPVVPKA